jgi:hypothetical protein
MPPRGNSVDPPAWWLADLDAAIERGKVSRTQLAEMLVPPRLRGDERAKAVKAARVKVFRFFDGDPVTKKKIRTAEVVRAWCAGLKLPPFEFRAASRPEADALALAQSDPERFLTIARTVMALSDEKQVGGSPAHGERRSFADIEAEVLQEIDGIADEFSNRGQGAPIGSGTYGKSDEPSPREVVPARPSRRRS